MLYSLKGYTTFCGDRACETGTHLAHRGTCLTPRDMCQILSEADLALGPAGVRQTLPGRGLTLQPIKWTTHALPPSVQHMRVEHRRRDIGVS